MTSEEIRTFLALVKTKNISKAAEQLYLSQSTVSHRLSSLEKEIGRPLFRRGKGQRDITLTPWGEELIPLAIQWEDLYQEALDLHVRDETLSLSIGCVHSVNNYLFPPFYLQLREAYPTMRLSIYTHHSWEIYDMLSARKLNVGFCNNLGHYANLATVPIFQEPFCLVHSQTGLAEEKQPVAIGRLDPSGEIFHTWSPEYLAWRETRSRKGFHPPVTINNPIMLEYLLLRPGTWSIVPQSIARTLQRRHALQVHCLENPPPEKICYMSFPKHQSSRQTFALGLFQSQLREFLHNLDRTFRLFSFSET